MSRAIGIIDAVEIMDEDGSRLVHRPGGLVFRFCAPGQPLAGTFVHLTIRPGGQVVAAAVDPHTVVASPEGEQELVALQEAAETSHLQTVAANQTADAPGMTTPVSSSASRAAQEAAARPPAPARPGRPRRRNASESSDG
jgi:hypothetical protein